MGAPINNFKNPKEIAHKFEDILVKISTPFSVASGFFLKNYSLIITNEHVVRGHKNVVIEGKNFKKHEAHVVYMDKKYDLAFLKTKYSDNIPDVNIKASIDIEEGEIVLALGHPFDLKYTVTQGIVSNTSYYDDNIRYIQHDAALNPGNSGGPLVDKEGHIIGVNSFIFQEGQNMGFALSSPYLLECLLEFKTGPGELGVRCTSCLKICFEKEGSDRNYCPNCGAKIEYISHLEPFRPIGIPLIIENTISDLGFDASIVRQGMNNWVLERGSSRLNLSYFEKNGLLIADTYLCTLPKDKLGIIYNYLLLQNNILEGMSFSLKNQDIILSLVIYDQFIQIHTLKKMIQNLLSQADKYDNVLVEEFGAQWIENR